LTYLQFGLAVNEFDAVTVLCQLVSPSVALSPLVKRHVRLTHEMSPLAP
jgi:hypothetical protein